MTESYIRVSVTLVRALPKSVLVRTAGGDEVFVARSCIHGADERTLDRIAEESEVEFRVFAWLAEKEGL